MKVIENNKLFGKINLIDILLLIVVIILASVVYNVAFKSETTVNLGAKYYTTQYIVKMDDLPIGASDYLKIGADVYDNETNVFVGKLTDFESGDYIMIKANRELNEFVETKIPNRETVYATIEVDVSDQGSDLITSNNYFVKVGKYMSIRCENFAGGGYVTLISREAE